MKLTLTKTSDPWGSKKIECEVKTLKNLLKIEKKYDCQMIISFKNKTIEIYDDYRE